jgi:error-prone DNA polymerase
MSIPLENRTCIEWNKDDIEALGFLKVDVLALGMLTCIRKAFDLVEQHYGEKLTLANVKQDEPGVYDMICRADTVGVFQIESRAQMSMLPRVQPREFYDLVIEVAIVRPGPIQGDMVHPYLKRRKEKREGLQTVAYPKDELIPVLNRTLGIPLFQEQAMEIAIVAAEFTEAEADGLRRSMATFKAKGKVSDWQKKLVGGMVARGYSEEFAQRVFKQLEGFGSYGFPESHAVSFALLAYISSWLKWKYPDVFAAALLNSQPMGFYQPAQIVIDAKNHAVEVRPVDVNYSMWDNTLEVTGGAYYAIRLGFRQVKGINEDDANTLIHARNGQYTAVCQLLDAGVSQFVIEKLADADAFRSMGLDRRSAWWEIPALQDKPTGIYTGQESESVVEPQLQLPFMSQAEHVIEDYAATSLSLKAHPVSFVREKLNLLGISPNQHLEQLYDGAIVKVAGLVLVRQRPGTAKGICFITIEDEGGIANLVVFENIFNKFKKEILRSRLLMVEGKLQIEGKADENKVIHVVVHRCFNVTNLLQEAAHTADSDIPILTLSRADEKADTPDPRKQQAVTDVYYKGRNFR